MAVNLLVSPLGIDRFSGCHPWLIPYDSASNAMAPCTFKSSSIVTIVSWSDVTSKDIMDSIEVSLHVEFG